MADLNLKSVEDREVWLRCFSGAITGLLSSPQTTVEPDQLLKQAGRLADMAVGRAQSRRAPDADEWRSQPATVVQAPAANRMPASATQQDRSVAEVSDVTETTQSPNGAPAFAFYASDFLAATGLMSNASVGAYIRMLSHAWSNGAIPDSPVALARAMSHSMGDPAFDEIWGELRPKWFLTSRGWINCRLELVRWERACYLEKQQQSKETPVAPVKETRRQIAS